MQELCRHSTLGAFSTSQAAWPSHALECGTAANIRASDRDPGAAGWIAEKGGSIACSSVAERPRKPGMSQRMMCSTTERMSPRQVSAIFVSIYAVAHALRSNMPMPQFLPVPLEVLTDLGTAVDEHLRESRESRPASPASSVVGISQLKSSVDRMQLATLYAFAEREALTRLCQAVDEVSCNRARLRGFHS